MSQTVKPPNATYASLPSHSGDGYGFGGGSLVIIGEAALSLGEGERAHNIARYIVKAVNAFEPFDPKKSYLDEQIIF